VLSLLTIGVDPEQQDQFKNYAIMGGGILIATAIVIFGWRIIKDMSVKTVAILVALIVFTIAFVIPNLRG
jgi:hypothetical protein